MIQSAELIARSRGARGEPRVDLGPVSFELEAHGAYALVGTRADGVDLLLELLAGAIAPRKGNIAIDGAPASRGRTVAHVPHEPDLPDVLTVGDYLSLAARVRGEPATLPRERLATLGVAPLEACRLGSLALEEVRAVAMVEALTSQAKYLFLAEPLADLDPRAAGRIRDVLAARIDAGVTLVFSTASPIDARALAREQLHFTRGRLTLRTTGEEAWKPALEARGARLVIRSEGARLLLAELASDPTFATVHGKGAELVVTGRDPVAMASAVATASRHANAELDVLSFESVDDHEGAP